LPQSKRIAVVGEFGDGVALPVAWIKPFTLALAYVPYFIHWTAVSSQCFKNWLDFFLKCFARLFTVNRNDSFAMNFCTSSNHYAKRGFL